MIIRRIRTACWIPKATHTHSVYVILIFFSTASMIARRRFNVTLSVHCLVSTGVILMLIIFLLLPEGHYQWKYLLDRKMLGTQAVEKKGDYIV